MPYVQSLALAVRFLTVVPLPGAGEPGPRSFGRAVAFFPLVGLLLGLLSLAVDAAGRLIWPASVSSAIVLATLVAATGALHFDGLLDTCDGLFLWPPERRLEAMRDSRVGGFGVAGGLAVYLIKLAALASLAGPARLAALVLAPALGRLGIAVALVLFPYARAAGAGSAFKASAGAGHLVFGAATALAAAAWFGPAGLSAFAAALGGAWLVAAGIRRRLGGLTGDTYGFVCETVETLTFLALAAQPIGGRTWTTGTA